MIGDRGRGVVAAGAALGAQWLVHVGVPEAPFAPFSAGEWVVRAAPGAFATAAIELLGHQAMRLVGLATIATSLGVGALFGARRGVALSAAAFAGTLAVGFADPRHPSGAMVFVAAGVAATFALAALSFTARPDAEVGSGTGVERRVVLRGGLFALAGVALGGAAVLRRALAQAPIALVRADRRSSVPIDRAFPAVDGLSPAITSRRGHYTVDINLIDPEVSPTAYVLRVHGAVNRRLELSLDDLRDMPTTEVVDTLTCISNLVGGDLVGTARWTGVWMNDLLDRAQTRGSTLQVRAADGYHESYPIEFARTFLAAFGMNGLLLPRSHGFPVRLIAPGRYGVKNVKWVTELEVTDEEMDGYWVERGWDRQAIIRTSARFDVPAYNDVVPSTFVAAGVAWAGDRGIDAVEVSSDGGRSWQRAHLERAIAPLAWRRWQITLQLPNGTHTLAVRATDGTDVVQDGKFRPPHPSGSSGYHRIDVNVRDR